MGRNCGLIGPNAAVVVGQTAFWASPDRQFYSYGAGGQPQPIPCPIRQDFAERLAASQGDKVVASSNAEFSEVRFDYPDSRDGYENSRYLALALAGPDTGAWHRGIMARTGFVDAGPSLYPLGVTFEGQVYLHEKGHSADGQPFAWFIETADSYLRSGRLPAGPRRLAGLQGPAGTCDPSASPRGVIPQDVEQVVTAPAMGA